MPVTSEDVAFTIKSYLTPATVSRFLSHLEGIVGGLEYIDGKSTDVPGIVVVDDYTVRVDLKDPGRLLPPEADRSRRPLIGTDIAGRTFLGTSTPTSWSTPATSARSR